MTLKKIAESGGCKLPEKHPIYPDKRNRRAKVFNEYKDLYDNLDIDLRAMIDEKKLIKEILKFLELNHKGDKSRIIGVNELTKLPASIISNIDKLVKTEVR